MPRRLSSASCSPAVARCASAARRRRRCCAARHCCCGRRAGCSAAVRPSPSTPGREPRLSPWRTLPDCRCCMMRPAMRQAPCPASRLGSYGRANSVRRALAVSPCDAPLLPEDLFTRLSTAAGSGAAMAETADGVQPLCAVWPVSALADLVARAGRRRASADLAHARWHRRAARPLRGCRGVRQPQYPRGSRRPRGPARAGRLTGSYQRYSCAMNPSGKGSACGGSSTNPCVPASARKSPEPLGARGTAARWPRSSCVTATGMK